MATTRPSLLAGEAHRLAAEGIVLAQRVALPVVLHEDAPKVGVALDVDAHEVPDLAFMPVGGRPDRDHRRHRVAVVQPDLDADARRSLAQREQVVVDREAPRLRAWRARV